MVGGKQGRTIYGSFAKYYPGMPSVGKRRLIREGGGGAGQSPGSVIQVDPQTLVVVCCPPTAARRRQPGPYSQWAPETACGFRINRLIHIWAMNRSISLCGRPSVTGWITGPTGRWWRRSRQQQLRLVWPQGQWMGLYSMVSLALQKISEKCSLRIDRGRQGMSYRQTKWSCVIDIGTGFNYVESYG